MTTNEAYTRDDFVIAAIPSAEQVSLLINASALVEGTGAGGQLKKVSVSSMESDTIADEPVAESVQATASAHPGDTANPKNTEPAT